MIYSQCGVVERVTGSGDLDLNPHLAMKVHLVVMEPVKTALTFFTYSETPAGFPMSVS